MFSIKVLVMLVILTYCENTVNGVFAGNPHNKFGKDVAQLIEMVALKAAEKSMDTADDETAVADPANCIRTKGGSKNNNGACCYFPFVWRGNEYRNKCPTLSGVAWCYTNAAHTSWGDCILYDQGVVEDQRPKETKMGLEMFRSDAEGSLVKEAEGFLLKEE